MTRRNTKRTCLVVEVNSSRHSKSVSAPVQAGILKHSTVPHGVYQIVTVRFFDCTYRIARTNLGIVRGSMLVGFKLFTTNNTALTGMACVRGRKHVKAGEIYLRYTTSSETGAVTNGRMDLTAIATRSLFSRFMSFPTTLSFSNSLTRSAISANLSNVVINRSIDVENRESHSLCSRLLNYDM